MKLRLGRGRDELPPAPFVVGVGRSGTTLLRLMLDAHPELAIPPETHFLEPVIERFRAGGRGGELVDVIVAAREWGDFSLSERALRERVAADEPAADVVRAFYGLYAEQQEKPRWGDKTPGHVRRMREIAGLLPEARFVHLIRDGRDVLLSRRARGMGAGKPVADTALLWKRRIERARRDARRLRGRYLELRYEDLVAEPEGALRAICELCALEFDPVMLSHHERAAERLAELSDLEASGSRKARSGAERLASHALTERPPTAERIGIWRAEMAAADREEFEAVAGDLLSELGYET